MYYVINCHCGYKYFYDEGWKIVGSKWNERPKMISRDLKLIACPECGSMYYDIHDIY